MSMSRHTSGSASWVAWLPLVFVGAMLFWTIALGLGGLSLVTVGALYVDDKAHMDVVIAPPPTAAEPMPGNLAASDGIVVRLQESPDPQDVNDSATAAPPAIEIGHAEAGP